MKPLAVIILPDTLQALGLQQLLRSRLGVETCLARDVAELPAQVTDTARFFFTNAVTFVRHLQFFLPNKERTLLVTASEAEPSQPNMIQACETIEALTERLRQLIESSHAAEGNNQLTRREVEVLRLVASGCINKEIAQQLNVSVNTVLTHRKNITAKLGIKSVSGLSVYAVMNGLVSPTQPSQK